MIWEETFGKLSRQITCEGFHGVICYRKAKYLSMVFTENQTRKSFILFCSMVFGRLDLKLMVLVDESIRTIDSRPASDI